MKKEVGSSLSGPLYEVDEICKDGRDFSASIKFSDKDGNCKLIRSQANSR